MITEADVSKWRIRMNIVFSRYEKEYTGRIPDLIGQTADYMNDIINSILADVIPSEEFAEHLQYAIGGIHRMNDDPTEKEKGIWEEMWEEIGYEWSG